LITNVASPEPDAAVIYPVPSGDVIHLPATGKDTDIISYLIIDSEGKIVAHGRFSGKDTVINISSLPKGIYSVLAGNKSYKVIKH
jgi:hypothetical protein